MIDFIRGKVIELMATKVILDVNGVGYGINLTVPCAASLSLDQEVALQTFLSVKEDSLTLFGFTKKIEKEVFLELIEVNGIGPKMGQRILSEIQPENLVDLICSENVAGLVKLKGVGQKTAELLVLQLKSRLAKWAQNTGLELLSASASEAVQALVSLGLKDIAARKAVEKAIKKLGENAELAPLITEALRYS